MSILFLTTSVCKSPQLFSRLLVEFDSISPLFHTLSLHCFSRNLPIKLPFLCHFNNFKAANVKQTSLKSHHNLWCGMKNIIKWLKCKDIVSLFIQIQMCHIKETPYKMFKEFSQFISTKYSNKRVHHSVNENSRELVYPVSIHVASFCVQTFFTAFSSPSFS